MMMKKQAKQKEAATIRAQARPLGRPSAAAAGFSTVGMSDQQVMSKVKNAKTGKAKAAPKKAMKCTRADKAKVSKNDEQEDDEHSVRNR